MKSPFDHSDKFICTPFGRQGSYKEFFNWISEKFRAPGRDSRLELNAKVQLKHLLKDITKDMAKTGPYF